MALFNKDRERDERPRAAEPAPVATERASREVEMFEREREKLSLIHI